VSFTSDFVTDCPLNRNFYSSNFDSAFLSNFFEFFCVFLENWIGNLISSSKISFKMWSGQWKWVWQAILSRTVLLLDRKFDRDSKNVLKKVIRWLQVGFVSDFVADKTFKPSILLFKFWRRFPHWLYRVF